MLYNFSVVRCQAVIPYDHINRSHTVVVDSDQQSPWRFLSAIRHPYGFGIKQSTGTFCANRDNLAAISSIATPAIAAQLQPHSFPAQSVNS